MFEWGVGALSWSAYFRVVGPLHTVIRRPRRRHLSPAVPTVSQSPMSDGLKHVQLNGDHAVVRSPDRSGESEADGDFVVQYWAVAHERGPSCARLTGRRYVRCSPKPWGHPRPRTATSSCGVGLAARAER